MTKVLCAVFFALGMGAGILIHSVITKRRVRRLSADLESVVRGEGTMLSQVCREGPYGLLASQLELAVLRSQREAQRLETEKQTLRKFTDGISHQIKTPLAGIVSYLELLSRGETDPSRLQKITSATELAGRIEGLVRGLLELSRVENGIALRYVRLSARELGENACQIALGEWCGGREVKIAIPDGLWLRGDEKWLTQVLVNLVSNALRYSSGAVEISAQSAERTVIFRITNPGSLSSEVLSHMFQRFYRAEPDGRGFGLGLPLARAVARLHKGDLRAENTEKGVALVLSLPKNDCAEPYITAS